MTHPSYLSGGEKSLVALAFMFAVFLARPCPFYILDEVEAALDDINIDRFLQLVKRYSDRAQFIVVTHQKRTMDAADTLYGVSMGGDGISRVVSRKLAGHSYEEGALSSADEAAAISVKMGDIGEIRDIAADTENGFGQSGGSGHIVRPDR